MNSTQIYKSINFKVKKKNVWINFRLIVLSGLHGLVNTQFGPELYNINPSPTQIVNMVIQAHPKSDWMGLSPSKLFVCLEGNGWILIPLVELFPLFFKIFLSALSKKELNFYSIIWISLFKFFVQYIYNIVDPF